MPPSKSGSNLRQLNRWQRDAARAEYLRHPDASIAEVAKATNVAPRTVARAREALVKEGLLAPGRNATTSAADAAALAVAARTTAEGPNPQVTDPPADQQAASEASPPARGTRTVDGDALRSMNKLLDELAEDEDNEATRKRMLKQVQRFAFDPTLHPDTRMSASQLWAKLLDMARSKDLGPGKPKNLAEAIERATDFCRAATLKVMVPAFFTAFPELAPAATDGQAQAMEPTTPAQAPDRLAGPADNDPPSQGKA